MMGRLLGAVAVVGLLALPAGASHTGLLYGASSRVLVTLSEFKFSPSTITLAAGESVDLVLENKGIISHVFMVYPAPKKPYKGVGDWSEYILQRTYFQGMGEIMVHEGRTWAVSGASLSEVAVDPGKTITVTFTPNKKGRFEFGCHLSSGAADHYTAGMKGLLMVK